MGYTSHSIEALEPYLDEVKSVCELGAQNHHDLPGTPFMSEWYQRKGIDYMCIDLNGENEAKKWDLDQPVKTTKKFDLVTDMGTTEHLKDIYMGFWNMNKLAKVGAMMYHENPKTNNWPKHGYHYRTTSFYTELAEKTGYSILKLDEHPACWNTTDGWIIRCLMIKMKEGFIEREQFPHVFPV